MHAQTEKSNISHGKETSEQLFSWWSLSASFEDRDNHVCHAEFEGIVGCAPYEAILVETWHVFC